MDQIILATDIFGILTIIILIMGVLFDSTEKSNKKSAYLLLLFVILGAMSIDALSCFFLLQNHTSPLLHYLVLLDMIGPFLVFVVFLQYLYLHIKKKNKIPQTLFRWGVIIGLILICVCAYEGMKGNIFVLENGYYAEGPYYFMYLLSYVSLLAYSYFIIFLYRKELGKNDTLATITFMTIPIVAVLINCMFPEAEFSIAALSLSCLVIHIMIRSENESHLIEKEVSTKRLAFQDGLTGLNNRMAFREMTNTMIPEIHTGIIFCDINGLKYVNDHYGHKEGDSLILKFSNLLEVYFRKDDIYRMSGDEFIILMPRVNQEFFLSKVEEFQNKVASYEIPLASIGQAFGQQKDIFHLIDLAEQDMYKDKREFHKKYSNINRDRKEEDD